MTAPSYSCYQSLSSLSPLGAELIYGFLMRLSLVKNVRLSNGRGQNTKKLLDREHLNMI